MKEDFNEKLNQCVADAKVEIRRANLNYRLGESLLDYVATLGDSPIEKLFGVAYAKQLLRHPVSHFNGPRLWWPAGKVSETLDDFPFTVSDKSLFRFGEAHFILQQFQLPEARVDFLIMRYEKLPGKGDALHRRTVIVECDGHDFHERTKEQAQRDRSRDRAFQSQGMTIFRFTGSELWEDADDCAAQVETFFCRIPD